MGKKSKRKNQPATKVAAAAAATATPSAEQRQSGKSKSRASQNGNMKSNPFTATTQSELDAITTPHITSTDEHDPIKAKKDATCWICLEGLDDGNHEPLRRNCACRGDNNYAHLSCLVSLATSKSEEIWTGKVKAEPNANQLAFGRPWESCSNCKQYFAGQLRLDLAYEYARSTEGMVKVNSPRGFRHIIACSWITKSMPTPNPNVHSIGPDENENYRRLAAEYEKLLDLIKSSYPIYQQSNPALLYIHVTLKQIEAETLSNYSNAVGARLLAFVRVESAITNDMKRLYNKWQDLSSLSIAQIEALKGSMLGQDPLGLQQINTMLLQTQGQVAVFNNQFSHLASANVGGEVDATPNGTDIARLSEKLMETYIEERGESSTDGIMFSYKHAVQLWTMANKPFKGLQLLKKTVKTSKLSLGPSHTMTKEILSSFGSIVYRARKVANKWDSKKRYCPVKSYEEDCDIYVVDTKGLNGAKIDGTVIGENMGWDPAEVILNRGALVKCVDLLKASHLNGKRAWVMEYDEATKRHEVEFEDDIKSCLVKPGNLRLLFFEDEYEQAIADYGASGSN